MIADVNALLFYGSALIFSSILGVCLILISNSNAYPVVRRSKKEKYFLDPATGENIEFPTITNKSSVYLSVVVPAYNEEVRLPPMLDECLEFLEQRSRQLSFKYEVIVVSDGSSDNTVERALEYSKKYGTDKVRVLKLETNRGKGGAVRLGMQSSRGALLLFADADGATKFCDLVKMEESLKGLIDCDDLRTRDVVEERLAISIGSRAHLEEEAVASLWLFAVKGIRDTQCGFKLFTRKAAKICFISLHVERWAFDVELLYIAQKLNIPISEVAVNWTEIDGSKVTPIWSWIQMGIDLGLIWLRYTIGAWKIKHSS